MGLPRFFFLVPVSMPVSPSSVRGLSPSGEATTKVGGLKIVGSLERERDPSAVDAEAVEDEVGWYAVSVEDDVFRVGIALVAEGNCSCVMAVVS